MIRRNVFEWLGRYDQSYRYAEDTELYTRLGMTRPMLAVRQPHFLYRVSEGQKTQVMRQHPDGDLVATEPARIQRTYQRAYALHSPPWHARPGQFSKRGVLEVGLQCTHSCKFCYYSYLDGSDDQFQGMRKAKMRSLEECKAILDGMAESGLTHFDVTGGEPTLHKDLVEIVRYGFHELGLRARIITLGQFLMRPRGKERIRLVDQLIEAGLDDFLLSIHAVDEEIFQQVSGESFARLAEVMDYLDDIDFSYTTNTIVYEHNYRHLPEVAAHIAKRRVRMANFIVMNTYFQWNQDERMLGIQARYRDVRPMLEQACSILEEAGVAVNIRYGPLCAYRGMEKHFVGVLGVELDPYEWRTTLETGELKNHESVDHYIAHQRQTLEDPRSMYTKAFGRKCDGCSMRIVCDGVDEKYIDQYGWDEFDPYPLAPGQAPLETPMGFRLFNPGAHVLKNEGGTRQPGLVAPSTQLIELAYEGALDEDVQARINCGDNSGAQALLEARAPTSERCKEQLRELREALAPDRSQPVQPDYQVIHIKVTACAMAPDELVRCANRQGSGPEHLLLTVRSPEELVTGLERTLLSDRLNILHFHNIFAPITPPLMCG
jgi:pyrroloquinoline quinone biosynthesis protein E